MLYELSAPMLIFPGFGAYIVDVRSGLQHTFEIPYQASEFAFVSLSKFFNSFPSKIIEESAVSRSLAMKSGRVYRVAKLDMGQYVSAVKPSASDNGSFSGDP